MAIFSYITLVLCVHYYFAHLINVVAVFRRGFGKSGIASFYRGHLFLVACVYFAANHGWTF